MNKSPDIFYYNLSIGNNDLEEAGSTAGSKLIAKINEKSTITICENPSEYYCSVIRFSIAGFNIPVAYPLIQIGENGVIDDINETVYSFTLSSGNFNSDQTFVRFIPEYDFDDTDIPKTGTKTQTFNDYYSLFSYTSLINMWNIALKTATNNLNTKAGLTLTPPYFFYDATTQLISLYTIKGEFESYFEDGTETTRGIFFNTPFETFFNGARAKYIRPTNPDEIIYGKSNMFLIQNLKNNTVLQNNEDFIRTTFDYNSFGYYNFLKSIVVSTNMNVESETFSINSISQYQNQTYTNLQYINVLTDFIPNLSNDNSAGTAQQIFVYDAPSLYRVFEFKQTTPLYQISLDINMVDNYNNIYPMILDNGISCHFKLMFIKKELYKNNLLNLKNLK
jgi:hypothetical protein